MLIAKVSSLANKLRRSGMVNGNNVVGKCRRAAISCRSSGAWRACFAGRYKHGAPDGALGSGRFRLAFSLSPPVPPNAQFQKPPDTLTIINVHTVEKLVYCARASFDTPPEVACPEYAIPLRPWSYLLFRPLTH